MSIQPIETHYAGCRFRSRLEARWAVFFTHLGIRWEHEPEGFNTSAGRYLPDFRISIPQVKGAGHYQWFEVKRPDAPVDPRHAALAKGLSQPLIVARGMSHSYSDQLKASKYAGRLESPLMIYGVEEEGPWPAAFCDSTPTWSTEEYCTLGDNRHWCQEAVNLSLGARCHLALYGQHDGYMTYPPIAGSLIDQAYTAAQSERFGT